MKNFFTLLIFLNSIMNCFCQKNKSENHALLLAPTIGNTNILMNGKTKRDIHIGNISNDYSEMKRISTYGILIKYSYTKTGDLKFKGGLHFMQNGSEEILINRPFDETQRIIRNLNYLNIPLSIEKKIYKNFNAEIGFYYGINLVYKVTAYNDFLKTVFIYKNNNIYKNDVGAFIGLNYNFKLNDKLEIPILIQYQRGFKNIKIYDNKNEKYTTTATFFGFGIQYNL